MPNRIVRDSILTSESVCSLGWPEEVFYRRLMSIVDDYGRCEANPQLLRSRCYPLQTDAVRVADITRWMAACHDAGLILVYAVQGKQYLEVSKFGQQQRSASKCPPPPTSDSNCYQSTADAHLDVSVVGVVSVVEGVVDKVPRKRSSPASEFPRPDDIDEQVWGDWLKLRKAKRAEAGKAGLTIDQFLTIWCARGSQGLQADWLKPSELSSVGRHASNETPYQRSMRERYEEASGKRSAASTVIDITPQHQRISQ
jgi:hypothetical protein